MRRMIFLSYSRKDSAVVRRLYDRLHRGGYPLWFDQESLIAGQEWELEVRRAIKQAAAIVVCLSSSWIDDPGYVQRELKLALDARQDMPEGKVHTIPVKLDACDVPPALASLQWVDLTTPTGFQALERALDHVVSHAQRTTVPARVEEVDAYKDFVEDVIANGAAVYVDPWQVGRTAREKKFKRLLRGRLSDSFDRLERRDYQGIVDLWQPLQGAAHFRVDHQEWTDKPYFRAQIHAAKSHLFMAYVQLGQTTDFERFVPKAFKTLEEILKAPPYSLKGGAPDRLPPAEARTQNVNYRQTLQFALEWFRGWSGRALEMFHIPAKVSDAVQAKVRQRLDEIDFMLALRPNPDG